MAHIGGTARRRVEVAPEIRSYLAQVREAAVHPYAALLGLKTFDTPGLHQKVRQGLSFASLLRFLGVMRLPLSAAAQLLDIPPRTLQRRKDEGRFQPDESDRLVRLTRMAGLALELFEGDLDAALDWLSSPAAALGEATPLEMSRTGPGSQDVERLIGRLEHGVFS